MSGTFSDPVVASGALDGVWLHDPDDPEGTAFNFRFGRGRRTGAVEVEAVDLQYAGRTFPVTDFGPYESERVAVEAVIPNGPDYAATRARLQEFVRARKPLFYRDNRGRAMLVRLSAAQDRDEDYGTSASFTVSRVEG